MVLKQGEVAMVVGMARTSQQKIVWQVQGAGGAAGRGVRRRSRARRRAITHDSLDPVVAKSCVDDIPMDGTLPSLDGWMDVLDGQRGRRWLNP